MDLNRMTSPIWRAKDSWQEAEGCYTFKELIEASLSHGWLLSTPEMFIAAKPSYIGANEAEVGDLDHIFDISMCNTWHIYIFAGDLRKSLDKIPMGYKWLSYHKGADDSDLKYISINNLKKLLKKLSNGTPL